MGPAKAEAAERWRQSCRELETKCQELELRDKRELDGARAELAELRARMEGLEEGLGIIGGFACQLASMLLRKLQIDGPVDAVPVHTSRMTVFVILLIFLTRLPP